MLGPGKVQHIMALKTRLFTLLTTPALALAVGCSGTSFESGVDGTKKASELSDADVQAICQAAEETSQKFAEDNKDAFCKLSGAFAGALAGALGGGDPVAVCESAVSDCKSKPLTTEPSTCNPKLDDCDVTVGEIESCFNDSLDAAETYFADYKSKSCADLLAQTSGENTLNFMEPASCAAIEQRCPNISFGEPKFTETSTDS
jgi:hypothetical protein